MHDAPIAYVPVTAYDFGVAYGSIVARSTTFLVVSKYLAKQ